MMTADQQQVETSRRVSMGLSDWLAINRKSGRDSSCSLVCTRSSRDDGRPACARHALLTIERASKRVSHDPKEPFSVSLSEL